MVVLFFRKAHCNAMILFISTNESQYYIQELGNVLSDGSTQISNWKCTNVLNILRNTAISTTNDPETLAMTLHCMNEQETIQSRMHERLGMENSTRSLLIVTDIYKEEQLEGYSQQNKCKEWGIEPAVTTAKKLSTRVLSINGIDNIPTSKKRNVLAAWCYFSAWSKTPFLKIWTTCKRTEHMKER